MLARKVYFTLIMAIMMINVRIVFGQVKAPEYIANVAKSWATEYYNGTIDVGTPYYDEDETISAWIFTVFRESVFSKTEIEILVKKNWEQKKEAEKKLTESVLSKKNLSEAYQLLVDSWATLRNAQKFATVIVTEKNNIPHVAMAYGGLPPHYVSILDAEERVEKENLINNVKVERHYFISPIEIYTKFSFSNNNVFKNTILLDKLSFYKLPRRKNYTKRQNVAISQRSLSKTLTTEVIISGVPSYLSVPAPTDVAPRSCRQISSAMVLGYWDDNGYSKLIDGGGSGYEGEVGVDGWLNLVDELSNEMGTGGGSMTVVPSGIEEVCNDASYDNNYDFESDITSYYSSVPASDWSDFCDLIDSGYPFVYRIYGDSIIVTDPSSNPLTLYDVSHAVAAIGYKTTGGSPSQKWRIVHYNSIAVEDPCYMNEADMTLDITSIVEVYPGDNPPASPQGLVIDNPSSQGSNVVLDWDANSEADLDYYKVWRGTTPNWKTTSVTWEQNPAATNITNTTWTDNFVSIDIYTLNATYYRITAVDDGGNESDYSGEAWTTSSEMAKLAEGGDQPKEFSLYQNSPNPFNPVTIIQYQIPEDSQVLLIVFDIHGREVIKLVDDYIKSGTHTVFWNASNLPTGLYYYKILAGDFKAVRKMMLLK